MDYSKEGFDKIHKQADALSALEEARRWGFETLKIEERIRANNPGLRDFQLRACLRCASQRACSGEGVPGGSL